MPHKAAQYTLFGQLSLGGFLFICFLLIPHFLLEPNEGGISNYGLYTKTIVPYSLAFGLAGLLTLAAAHYLAKEIPHCKALRWTLIILGSLFIAVLLSTYPYKLNTTLGSLHAYVGAALLLSEIIFGSWLALFLVRNLKNLSLWLVQLLGFWLAVFTHFGLIHVLFIAELLASAAFGTLLVRTIYALEESSR